MTIAWACFAVIVTFAAGAFAAQAPPYGEPNRPQYHFTPSKNWINDPNGLVYFDGEYHLFYQYNPFGDTWGHMSWGHAVSSDLLHWKHLPLALAEENGIMMFSGSAVVDHQNTSGFGKDGQPPMIAIYTGHTPTKQTQDIAYSTDRGRTWTKFAGNPVIDENLKDFRDPKVFWHEPDNRWVMVVSVPDQRKVRFYGSPDLKKWTQLGEFGPQGAVKGIWECPDLFRLPIEGANEKKWVLVVQSGDESPGGGGSTQYFVGSFDGETFHNDNAKDVQLWADHGSDFFASQSWSDMPDHGRVWLAWMSDWRYANVEPTSPWRCAMTMPRELSLRNTKRGVRLIQRPIREMDALRDGRLEASDLVDAGQMLEIIATAKGDKDFSLTVCGDGTAGTVIGYDARQRQVFVDRTKSRQGAPFHKDFPGRHAAPIDGDAKLHIFVDQSSVEVFADDGASVITDNHFAPASARGLSVTGDVAIEAWKLKSVW